MNDNILYHALTASVRYADPTPNPPWSPSVAPRSLKRRESPIEGKRGRHGIDPDTLRRAISPRGPLPGIGGGRAVIALWGVSLKNAFSNWLVFWAFSEVGNTV